MSDLVDQLILRHTTLASKAGRLPHDQAVEEIVGFLKECRSAGSVVADVEDRARLRAVMRFYLGLLHTDESTLSMVDELGLFELAPLAEGELVLRYSEATLERANESLINGDLQQAIEYLVEITETDSDNQDAKERLDLAFQMAARRVAIESSLRDHDVRSALSNLRALVDELSVSQFQMGLPWVDQLVMAIQHNMEVMQRELLERGYLSSNVSDLDEVRSLAALWSEAASMVSNSNRFDILRGQLTRYEMELQNRILSEGFYLAESALEQGYYADVARIAKEMERVFAETRDSQRLAAVQELKQRASANEQLVKDFEQGVQRAAKSLHDGNIEAAFMVLSEYTEPVALLQARRRYSEYLDLYEALKTHARLSRDLVTKMSEIDEPEDVHRALRLAQEAELSLARVERLSSKTTEKLDWVRARNTVEQAAQALRNLGERMEAVYILALQGELASAIDVLYEIKRASSNLTFRLGNETALAVWTDQQIIELEDLVTLGLQSEAALDQLALIGGEQLEGLRDRLTEVESTMTSDPRLWRWCMKEGTLKKLETLKAKDSSWQIAKDDMQQGFAALERQDFDKAVTFFRQAGATYRSFHAEEAGEHAQLALAETEKRIRRREMRQSALRIGSGFATALLLTGVIALVLVLASSVFQRVGPISALYGFGVLAITILSVVLVRTIQQYAPPLLGRPYLRGSISIWSYGRPTRSHDPILVRALPRGRGSAKIKASELPSTMGIKEIRIWAARVSASDSIELEYYGRRSAAIRLSIIDMEDEFLVQGLVLRSGDREYLHNDFFIEYDSEPEYRPRV